MTTTTVEYVMCGRCKTEPATIHEDHIQPSFEIDGTLHQPIVALKSPLCESCLKAFVSETVGPVVEQETAEAAARKRKPIICDSCRHFSFQWLLMSIEGSPERCLCGTCLYIEIRDSLLVEALKIEDDKARRVAVLNAMRNARNARDQAFQATWGKHERQTQ